MAVAQHHVAESPRILKAAVLDSDQETGSASALRSDPNPSALADQSESSSSGEEDEMFSGAENGSDTNEDSSDESMIAENIENAMPKRGIFSKRELAARIGFCSQYFAVGLIYGGIPATTYGVFLGYLNVPAYVYSTVSVIALLPWSFKFFFGFINDTCPIRGLRRKPYMMIGWSICTAALVLLSTIALPEPYWCIDDATGEYIKKRTDPDGTVHAATPCNKEAASSAGIYAAFLMLAALGYVISDVAADGLTTEYAMQEPIERRGSTQTTAYLTRSLGQAVATLFVGLCMNGKQYNGSFSWTLSFERVCLILAIPSALMVPITALLVKEPRRIDKVVTMQEYGKMCWDLLRSKACFYVLVYSFMNPVIAGISTTATPQVKKEWAGVQNLQNQMFSLVGHLLFAGGLWLVKKYFLGVSWRLLIAVTVTMLQVIDCFFSTLTIFDIVRNQYFFLGETVLIEIPSAANFVVATFVIVEMADEGNEGAVYGLFTTAGNLGWPFAKAIANQVYGLFQPSLSQSENYIVDDPSFRQTVFASCLLSYFCAIAAMGWLYFLPDQKQQAQHRKKTWSKRSVYAIVSVVTLSAALLYGLTINFLAMDPSTMCLKIAGGQGCDHDASSR